MPVSIRVETEGRLRDFLADRIESLLPAELDDLVVGRLAAMGLQAGQGSGATDGAHCVLASPEGLGLSDPRVRTRISHKRRVPADAQEVRAFATLLRTGEKGLLVSVAGFTEEARRDAERAQAPLTLLDLDSLARLAVRHHERMPSDARARLPLTHLAWPG